MMRDTRASAAAREGDKTRKSSTSRSMTGCSRAASALPCALGALGSPDICEKPVGVGLSDRLSLSANTMQNL